MDVDGVENHVGGKDGLVYNSVALEMECFHYWHRKSRSIPMDQCHTFTCLCSAEVREPQDVTVEGWEEVGGRGGGCLLKM